MPQRLLLIALISGLIIVTAGSLIYAYTLSTQLNATFEVLIETNDELTAAENENAGLRSRLDALTQEKASLTADFESQQADLAETQAELTAAQSSLAELEASKAGLETSLSDQNRENAALTRKIDFYECDDTLEMDYSSVMAASSRLMAYVDGLPDVDHTSIAYRNTLWSNADSKIYGIRYVDEDRETYTRQFLVYFNEFGMKEGVLFVDVQCWLDAPVK